LGGPIDHASVAFQVSMQSAVTLENVKDLKDRVADMAKLTDALQRMIDITQREEQLQRQLADVTHDMNANSKQMQATANELRDGLADFDDAWRPIRSYFYWDRHCSGIPVCSSLRSLYDAMDGVDKLTEILGKFAHNIDQFDRLESQLLVQLPAMIATMQIIKGIAQTLTSSFSGMVTQMENMARNGTAMGHAFDAAKNDDSFYLPPEAFEDPDFQRALKLFLSPDGSAARLVITHKGDPATAAGISHVDPIMQAATEAAKGTPLAAANFYLAGTASTYKDIHDGSTYDLLIVVVASLCLIFVIMLAITKSLVAAAVIVGTVTLSLGSSCGLSILVWQHLVHLPLNWFVLATAVVVMLAVGSD
jgi:RND superfamily putative drug exporter